MKKRKRESTDGAVNVGGVSMTVGDGDDDDDDDDGARAATDVDGDRTRTFRELLLSGRRVSRTRV